MSKDKKPEIIKPPSFKGSRSQRRQKMQESGIDKRKMNKGGYYKGMPGCTVDELGNRKMLDFLIQEDGSTACRIYAHPQLCKRTVEEVINANPMIKGVVFGAVVDHLFTNKNPLNWPLKLRLRFVITLEAWRHKRKIKKQAKKLKDDKGS